MYEMDSMNAYGAFYDAYDGDGTVIDFEISLFPPPFLSEVGTLFYDPHK